VKLWLGAAVLSLERVVAFGGVFFAGFSLIFIVGVFVAGTLIIILLLLVITLLFLFFSV
jgi:hypothetical protein